MSVEDAERFLERRELAIAAATFNAAEAEGADPNRCSAGRWMVAMLRGDFEAAWLESDALRARSAHDPHRFWNGECLAGRKVIVRCLHGLGDTAQMLRYAPLLKATASRVTWEVAPRFLELASCFHAVDEAVTWGERAPAIAPSWDVQLEVMELPYIFRTRREDLPIAERYCTVPCSELTRASACVGERGPAIGLVWTAGEWNPARSIPFPALAPLLDIPSVVFWNLQGSTASGEARGLPNATEICGEGLLALAATIATLDLVITVDTLAAHLAGAMGKPVWLMLQKQADWRWMVDSALTPWYPTMRLFRQKQSGDWIGVVNQIVLQLRKEFL